MNLNLMRNLTHNILINRGLNQKYSISVCEYCDGYELHLFERKNPTVHSLTSYKLISQPCLISTSTVEAAVTTLITAYEKEKYD